MAAPAQNTPMPGCGSTIKRIPHGEGEYVISNQISVGPPSQELTLKPGAKWHDCISVLNRTERVITFKVSKVDIEASSDANQVLKIVDKGPFGISDWVTLGAQQLILQPGDDVVFPYDMQVPMDPPVGSNFGGIRLEADAPPSGVAVSSGLVSSIYVTIPGEVIRKLEIIETSVPRFITHDERPRLEFVVENQGNGIDHVRGDFTIRGAGGKVTDRIRTEEGRVLRGGKRVLMVYWSEPPWIGRFTPELKVISDGKTETRRFPPIWVIPPWKYVIALGIAIILPLLVLIYRRWRDARDWRKYLDEDDLDEFDDDDELDGYDEWSGSGDPETVTT